MARAVCPQCSQQLDVPDGAAGKTIRCPKCQQTFALPTADAPPPVSIGAVTADPPAPTVHAEEALTEKAPVPKSARPPEPDERESPRPRRDRPAPAKSSSLVLIVVACVAGLGLCSCGAVAIVAGYLSFGLAAAQHAEQEAHLRADQAIKARDIADAEKAAQEKVAREMEMALLEAENEARIAKEKAWLDKMKAEEDLKEKMRVEELAKPQHGEFKRLQITNNREVRTLHFSADGKSLYAATRAESVHSWDLATWKDRTYTLDMADKGFGGQEVGAAAFTPKGDKVFLGKHGGGFRWYDLTKDPAPQTSIQIGEPNRQLAFNHIAMSPDGSRVCTCHGDSVAYVWDVATRAKTFTLKDFRNQVFSADFHPKTEVIAAGAEDVQVFDPKTGNTVHLKGDGGAYSFRSLQFARAGRFLTGVNGNKLYHWNLDDPNGIPVKIAYDQAAQHVAYSPDGQRLAVAVHFTRIFFYDSATLTQRFVIDMRKDQNNWDSPHAIAYHPDGRRFAVARGSVIYLFDLTNFEK